MYGTRTDVKMEASICKSIRQHLSEEQIEENYQTVCKEISQIGCIYDQHFMEKVTKKCRGMALSQIPNRVFTTLQIMHIRKVWGIDI